MWANNSVFEYYSNTWGWILVFEFVFGWLFKTEYYSYSYSVDFLKPNIIRIRIRVIFQTEYYLYLYLGDFLKPNTTGMLYIFCSALILLMSGSQSLINGHRKICHRTFTFLMTGSTNPMKKWVGECSSLSSRRCQNYSVRQDCNLSSYTRVTSFLLGTSQKLHLLVEFDHFLIIFVFSHYWEAELYLYSYSYSVISG